MEWINNSRFLVTGGSSGIGLSIIKNLINFNPSHIYTTGFKSKLIPKDIDNKKNIFYKSFDLTSKEVFFSKEFTSFIEESRPNYLVHSAGDVLKRSSFEASDFDLYEKTMNLNFHSSHQIIRILSNANLITELKSSVFLSSISARLPYSKDSLHYASSKAALETFVRGISVEFPPSRFNCIAPSAIATRFQEKHSSKDRVNRIIDQTPLKRIGTPKDVTNLTLFLLSDLSSYITGSIYDLSGGR